MLKAIIVIVPQREWQRHNLLRMFRIALRTQKMRSKPAPAQGIHTSDQPDIYNQPQPAHLFGGQAQVAMIHMDNIINSVSMYTGSNMVSLGSERQVTPGHSPPHVDRQVVTYLVAERICRGR